MTALCLTDVRKSRGDGSRRVEILRGVALELAPGEIALLEGPSGSGKTTLLSVAAGLLAPDSGEVVLAGRSLVGMSAAERRAFRARHVGFVFQRANLLDRLTVRENVTLAADLAGRGHADVDRLLERLGIAHLADRSPDHLSGGEEHRVAVARGLVHRPAVVFADEPTGSLDGVTGRAVAQALVDLARSDGVAVLVASHDPRLRPFATRRLRIDDGVVSDEVT